MIMVDQQYYTGRRGEGERKSSFKKGIDANVGRRYRDDNRIKIRKEKREELLQKRRAIATRASDQNDDGGALAENSQETTTPPASNTTKSMIKKDNFICGIFGLALAEQKQPKVMDIPDLLRMLSNQKSSSEELLSSIRAFRRMLYIKRNAPILEFVQSGALPLIIQHLKRNNDDAIQFEVARVLTDVATSEKTSAIVENGAVPFLVDLLRSPNSDVRKQCAWCLGNVAGKSSMLRDVVLQNGVMGPLLRNIAHPANDSLLRDCVWSLSKLCRGKPQPPLPFVSPAIPYLAELVKGDTKEIFLDAIWALSYLSDGSEARIQAVMDSGVCPILILLLQESSDDIVTPVLRTLGNFVSGNDLQTQAVLDCDILSHVPQLVSSPQKSIRKETSWLVSNIAAGTPNQIGALMKLPAILSAMINFTQSAEWDVRKEAIWVIANIASGGGDGHIQTLVELGAIESICRILYVADMKVPSRKGEEKTWVLKKIA